MANTAAINSAVTMIAGVSMITTTTTASNPTALVRSQRAVQEYPVCSTTSDWMAEVQVSQYTHAAPSQTAAATAIGTTRISRMTGCTREPTALTNALATASTGAPRKSFISFNLLLKRTFLVHHRTCMVKLRFCVDFQSGIARMVQFLRCNNTPNSVAKPRQQP